MNKKKQLSDYAPEELKSLLNAITAAMLLTLINDSSIDTPFEVDHLRMWMKEISSAIKTQQANGGK